MEIKMGFSAPLASMWMKLALLLSLDGAILQPVLTEPQGQLVHKKSTQLAQLSPIQKSGRSPSDNASTVEQKRCRRSQRRKYQPR